MAEKVLSNTREFTGWKFSEWFKGNWKTVKELLKVGVPLVLASFAVNNPALIGFLTILGKFALDSGEYYFSVITK